MTPRRCIEVLVFLAVLGLVSGCVRGQNGPPTAERDSSTTTTTVPPRPPRFVLAGDSILYDVTPALDAALPATSAAVEGLVAPAVSRGTVRSLIQQAVAERPTEVLILMTGVWDRVPVSSGATIESPDWGPAYTEETIVPLVDAVAGTGTHILFLRPPPMENPVSQAELRRYGDAWEAYATTRPADLTVIDSGRWLESATEFRALLPSDDGALARARRTDGIHLCQEGAVRVANGIIELLRERLGDDWDPNVPDAWADGPWIERFEDGGQCPPP